MTTQPVGRHQIPRIIADVAGAQIRTWQRGYLADLGSAVAALAQLRRGAGKLPADVPELWGTTGTEELYQALPELAKWESEATHAENALFLALTLYASHQQSHRSAAMHKPDIELGAAVRRLAGEEIDEPIRRRFVRVGAAATPDVLAYRMREIVALLRGAAIPLDYARLAQRLYQAQTPDGMAEVRRVWGRSFHAFRSSPPPSADATPSEGTTSKDAE
ncbi:type I-E CRISPR-associated protein Cse2/CasB [Actinomadura gamaensis]|uniref:Type I-E CRISPR-associated protein Cse2/CasB n=1 Tax=Actinomadura gamaensis TaxID=1763541 RepID=A0ABV9TTW0_9ACTN